MPQMISKHTRILEQCLKQIFGECKLLIVVLVIIFTNNILTTLHILNQGKMITLFISCIPDSFLVYFSVKCHKVQIYKHV